MKPPVALGLAFLAVLALFAWSWRTYDPPPREAFIEDRGIGEAMSVVPHLRL